MTDAIRRIRRELAAKQVEVKTLEDRLMVATRTCQHEWGPIQAAHIRTEGYQDQGDPPGTMGVDRRLPCYIPATEQKRWKRVCHICGEEEYTTRTKQIMREEPEF